MLLAGLRLGTPKIGSVMLVIIESAPKHITAEKVNIFTSAPAVQVGVLLGNEVASKPK